jgi:hypothetical protein
MGQNISPEGVSRSSNTCPAGVLLQVKGHAISPGHTQHHVRVYHKTPNHFFIKKHALSCIRLSCAGWAYHALRGRPGHAPQLKGVPQKSR